MDLSYIEKNEKLRTRIRAHKLYANLDIEDWIVEFIRRKPRHSIFDLGCGNGNHLEMYLQHVQPGGSVAGLDREPALIEEARLRYEPASNLILKVGNMDEPLPFATARFDLCLSNFAIYNARDPRATLLELKRVLQPSGEVVLIGPTINNAKEIYDFNERLTGQRIDPITLVRTDRLRREILPIAREVFGSVTEEVINSYLTFADKEEFLKYYRATMLFEEAAEGKGYSHEAMVAACPDAGDIVLSKEMLALVATSNVAFPPVIQNGQILLSDSPDLIE